MFVCLISVIDPVSKYLCRCHLRSSLGAVGTLQNVRITIFQTRNLLLWRSAFRPKSKKCKSKVKARIS